MSLLDEGPVDTDEAGFAEMLDLHARVCGKPFTSWRATAWQRCEAGHTYWVSNGRYWCRPYMEGYSDPLAYRPSEVMV